MTSKELNLKLIEPFPEIKDVYYEETARQNGTATKKQKEWLDNGHWKD